MTTPFPSSADRSALQTILGAGGTIGTPLATELRQYTDQVRLVARQPSAVHPEDELVRADLLDPNATERAVAGSAVVYLTVGLPYDNRTWEKDWPRLLDNVLKACQRHGTKLVFFDNVYAFAPDSLDGMTETTPIAPATRKGRVRAQLIRRLETAHREGEVTNLIARAADFYGKDIGNGLLNELLIKRIHAGKRAQWLCAADQPHTFTYVNDAARATAQLGNDPAAYGRAWHLPTATEAPTAKQWAGYFGGRQPPQLLAPWLIRLLGIFVPTMRALHEMLYQYDRPYRFDSSAFTERYGWKATPIAVAVRRIKGA